MKFNEKLLKLRKENALSQEELGEKLNVTRQTVSKWELGETTPEMDKLVEIAKLFNVSTDDLLNDEKEETKSNTKNVNKGTSSNKSGLIIILVIILLALLGFLGYKIASKFVDIFSKPFELISSFDIDDINNETNASEAIDSVWGKLQEIGEGFEENNNKTSINNKYKSLYSGLISKHSTILAIKEVIKDNLDSTRKISVVYNDITAVESDELIKLIDKIEKENYLISLDYDEDGYLAKLNIADV